MMNKNTLAYALRVLDSQAAHMNDGSQESIARQVAYYDGMRRMLEMIISEAYTDNVYVITEGGTHKILA